MGDEEKAGGVGTEDNTTQVVPPPSPRELELEEQARAAAEQAAEYKNTLKEQADQIDAQQQEIADLKKQLSRKGKGAVKEVEDAVKGEATLLAKDVLSVILEVRNGIQHFETQCHFDTLLQKLGIK